MKNDVYPTLPPQLYVEPYRINPSRDDKKPLPSRGNLTIHGQTQDTMNPPHNIGAASSNHSDAKSADATPRFPVLRPHSQGDVEMGGDQEADRESAKDKTEKGGKRNGEEEKATPEGAAKPKKQKMNASPRVFSSAWLKAHGFTLRPQPRDGACFYHYDTY